MKKIAYILFALFLNLNLSAQDNSSESELRQQIQAEMEEMKQEFEVAMQHMQSMMKELQPGQSGENDVIINGDTIVIAPGGTLPESWGDMGTLFRQLPDDMGSGMDFFFGGSETEELFDLLDQLRGGFSPDSDELFPESDSPEYGDGEMLEAPKKKKRKSYSL